ncbi:MAG: NAD(P)H-dependent glycerol-3-phosphate dehydrogenase [Bauldia sp.]
MTADAAARSIQRIGIIGAGAWGTALAISACRAGRNTVLFGRNAAMMAAIAVARENARHLPGVRLDDRIRIAGDPAQVAAADAVILAVPSQELRGAAKSALGTRLAPGTPVVIAAKGIERSSGLRLSEVVAATLPDHPIAVISGPGFAADVAKGLPTAVTIASTEANLAEALVAAMASASLRPYAETDVTGVELGGALKNVLAIAAGVVAGRQLGASAHAALVARGFAEMRRFADAFGARSETLMGLSGLGDLVLSCSSAQSRNYAYGLALGSGEAPKAATLVEGVPTAAIVLELARQRGISMPLTEAVAAVIAGTLSIEQAVESLMARPLRREKD